MAICPGFHSKTSLPVLKDVTNVSRHPWEKTIKPKYSNKIAYAHNSIRNPVYPGPQIKDNKDRITFTIIGIKTNKDFIYCAHLVKMIHKFRSKTFDVPIIKGVTATEWPSSWNNLNIRLDGKIYCLTTPVIVLKNGEYFGGDKELKEFMESKYIYRTCINYRQEAMQDFVQYVKSTGRPFVYMDIAINEHPIGTFIFMLYSDMVPRTCENFLRLCTTRKGGYPGTPVHRIVKDGWIQCGGFGLKDTDLGCENFILPFDKRGVLGMCNDGRDVDCSTQFFVTLQPNDWMEHKYVAFGQLIDGENTLKKIEEEPTYYESPTSSIIIERSGLLNLDCDDIIINKRTREYINKHIEDLIETREFLSELLWQRLWAEIEARRQERKERRKLANRDSDVDSTELKQLKDLTGRLSSASSWREGEDKENNEFAISSCTMSTYEAEQFVYPQAAASTLPTVKPTKPFYLPLTDEPYPDEVDSTFDLKKFLKGDYCHEADLVEDLNKDVNQREVIKIFYSKNASDMFVFDDDDCVRPSDIDSLDEEEIADFIRNNVERVSFAGDIIKNIRVGALHKEISLVNLLECRTRSELPLTSDDNLEKARKFSTMQSRRQSRKSNVLQFTDEHIRKFRRASVFERGPARSCSRAQTPKEIDTGYEELPELAKHVKLTASPKSPPEEEEKEDKKLPKLFDRRKSTLRARESLVNPDELNRKQSDTESRFEGLSHEQIQKLRKISRIATGVKIADDNESESSESILGLQPDEEIKKLPSDKEALQFEKKRRQTLFAKDLASVKSYQTDFTSDTSIEGEEKKRIIRFPSGTPEARGKIKRRQTGYTQNVDLNELLADIEEEEKGEENEQEQNEEKEEEKEEKDEDKNEEMEEIKAETPEMSDNAQPLTPLIRNSDDDEPEKSVKPDKLDKPGKPKKPDDFTESVFLRSSYNPQLDKNAGLPKLKDRYYRRYSDTTDTKRLFLTFGKGIPASSDDVFEPKMRYSMAREVSLPKLRFINKRQDNISSDYVAILADIGKNRSAQFRAHAFTNPKRPFLTVEEYQEKNRQRLENIKNEESKAKTKK